MAKKKKNFYVVVSPFMKIYNNWDDCEKAVKGVSNVIYKGFKTEDEAQEYYNLYKEKKKTEKKKSKVYITAEEIQKVILGNYENLKEAVMDCEYTSQAEAYLRLLNGDNVFITGPAGSGKSYVVQQYCEIRQKIDPNIKVVKTSTTGLSAANINGVTIHSYMGVGVNKLNYEDYHKAIETEIEEEIYRQGLNRQSSLPEEKEIIDGIINSSYSKKENAIKRIRRTDILIIDEISMMSSSMFTFLYELIKESRKKIQVIVSGDFSQLPPVATKEDIDIYGKELADFCYNNNAWKEMNFTTCYLDKLYRAKDIELASVLQAISTGQGSTIIPKLKQLPKTQRKFKKGTALLLSTNANVDKINHEEQQKNEGKEYTNLIEYSGEPQSSLYKKAVRYAKLCNIPEKLTLRVGDTIMCNRNIKVPEGNILINGQRYHKLVDRVTELKNGMIGEFIVSPDGHWGIKLNFNQLTIEYYFTSPHLYEMEVKYVRDEKTDELIKVESPVWVSQFPFKLAYAITIHKSQGQTFSHITIDLTKCWTEGLGYVALSRAMSISGIILLEDDYGKTFNSLALKINAKSLVIKKSTQEQAKKDRMKYVKENIELFNNIEQVIE